MASLTQWTWAWTNSGRKWRIGKPGMLQSVGSQSQKWLSDWTSLLRWPDPIYIKIFKKKKKKKLRGLIYEFRKVVGYKIDTPKTVLPSNRSVCYAGNVLDLCSQYGSYLSYLANEHLKYGLRNWILNFVSF